MRFVVTCLMSLLLVPTLVASTPPTSPPWPHPQALPHSQGLPMPQPSGSMVGYVHEKSHHIGVVAGWDHGGHYNVVPVINRNGAPDFLREVVVKAHPYDVHHYGTVHPELGASLAQGHQQNPPPFIAHPTEPHPNSIHHLIKAHLAAGANVGHGGTSGHGGAGGH